MALMIVFHLISNMRLTELHALLLDVISFTTSTHHSYVVPEVK